MLREAGPGIWRHYVRTLVMLRDRIRRFAAQTRITAVGDSNEVGVTRRDRTSLERWMATELVVGRRLLHRMFS